MDSLYARLSEHATARPTAPCLTFAQGEQQGTTWSYAQVRAAVDRVALVLARHTSPGATFVVDAANRPFTVAALLAASASGRIAVFADPRLTERELVHVFELSSARLAFVRRDRSARAMSSAAGMVGADVLEADDQPDGGLSLADPPPAASAVGSSEGQVVELIFTSGSTSLPKAVMLTDRSLIHGSQALAAGAGYSMSDSPLIALPLAHAAAQIHQLLPTLLLGGRSVLVDRFSASGFFAQACRHDATTSALFATPMRLLLARGSSADARRSNLRHITFAQSLEPAEYADWRRRFGIALQQLWGMTETSGLPVMSPLAGDRRLESMGLPVPQYEVAVVRKDGTPADHEERGELVVRARPGIEVCSGYYADRAATSALFRDGWLHSGDVVRRDRDGYIHFIGRDREIIRRGGNSFSALEVEAVIRSVPGVVDVAVIGLPDPLWDQRVVAFVVRQDDRPTAAEIASRCEADLAPYKRPEDLTFLADLPRTAVGKVQKHLLATLMETA